MARVISNKRYEWEPDKSGNRYWYRAKWTVSYDHAPEIVPRPVESGLGNVTRNTDYKSDTFNRWFGSIQILTGPAGHKRIEVVKSDPMLTKEAAMAWVEVIERMNRS